jgi:adenylyltransferase/sulfurtransferase
VQLQPARAPKALDLATLAGRLRPIGQVEERAFLLRYHDSEVSFTVFPDGRMIVEGTEDPGRARAVYSRYVGD